ncbi:MAG TPA: FIST N-terminal domain-containing protein [Nitriliruptorales bacterium]
MYQSSSDGRRWVGVGSSAHPDPREAGEQAARAAVEDREPALLVVFAADGPDLPGTLKAIRAVAPDAALIGCSTAGEIHGSEAGDGAVVVTALGGPGFQVQTEVVRGASADLHAAGSGVAAAMTRLDDPAHHVLLLLSDGLSGNQQEIVRGAYAALGASTPLVGGCAGDGLRMERTHQFHGDEVLTDAVVGAAIGSDAPLGIGVEHGWHPVGDQLLVTASEGNRVLRLDDRPALDVYLEALDAPEEARTDPAAFTRFAITHPLGLERRRGTEVRFIGEADFEDRALVCIASVPQGELAWLMEGDHDSVLTATDAACDGARAAIGGHDAIGVLAFDCIARRGVLQDSGISEEIARVRARFPTSPLAGFYTYGEFARTHGTRGFHNQTLVLLAVA